MIDRVGIFLLLLLLAGCATQRIPFPEAELSALNLVGDKTVRGTVFLIDQHGEKQVGAGSEVTLEPLSSYSEHWYQFAYLGNRAIGKVDPRYEKYVRRVTADKDGRFSFGGVAPGPYLLTAPLFWRTTTCSINVVKTKVMISNKIAVTAEDRDVDIPLTKKYASPIVVCDLYNQGAWEKEFGF
jgi:hypothetical protein